MKLLRRLMAALFVVGLLYVGWQFAARNGEAVRLDYLLGETPSVPLWSAMGSAFAVGVAVAFLFGSVRLVRAALEGRRYRSAIAGLEGDIDELRNLPVVESKASGTIAPGAEYPR